MFFPNNNKNEVCKNCQHFYGKPDCSYGVCYRYGEGLCPSDEHCPRWEPKDETPQSFKWKRIHEDFDREKDCTIVVPRFYGNHCGRLSGLVSESTVYVYKAITGEFYCPNEYPVEMIPFDDMFDHWYVNLDEIGKPWLESKN